MNTRVLGLTASAFILAYGAVGAMAQNPQPGQEQVQSDPMAQDEGRTTGQGSMMQQGTGGTGAMGRDMMQGGMMGRGMMGRGMMAGGGCAGGSPIMFRMMFALADSDGSGTISLQEFQAAHERIFKAMDANKDGQLSPDEIMAFMHGAARAAPRQ